MEFQYHKFVFQAPSSLFLNGLSLINLLICANGGISELRGKNLPYSKFLKSNPTNNAKNRDSISTNDESKTIVSGRIGMIICYTPAFVASLGLLLLFRHESSRMLLLKLALALHFFKRVVEVLFVHRYGGRMMVNTSIAISISYLSTTLSIVYAQHLSHELQEPEIDLKHIGVLLCLIGMIGNFYHHYLLSQLRQKRVKVKEYKIPKGGLFDLVICPHYLFEIILFVGLCFISQTMHSISIAVGTMFYLVGRSFATRQWYISRFEDFPQDVKALIPYVL